MNFVIDAAQQFLRMILGDNILTPSPKKVDKLSLYVK